jgi:hypothetical protein
MIKLPVEDHLTASDKALWKQGVDTHGGAEALPGILH